MLSSCESKNSTRFLSTRKMEDGKDEEWFTKEKFNDIMKDMDK